VIDTTVKLATFLPRLWAAGWTALDTEADSLHAYPEKLCLIQLSLPGEDTLLDPLAGLDFTPVWDALAQRELMLHGADYDLRMLYRTYRFVPSRVFDTMLAARLLGFARFGLTDLVEQFLGLRLDKAPQKADWAKRPLTERMFAYARNDTRHLNTLTELLRGRLAAKGRGDWHRQMCDALIRDCTRSASPPTDEPWRLKGAYRLSRRALAVLRELWHWREREAVAANKPPYFILGHEAVVALAEQAASGADIDGLIPLRFSERRRTALHEAVLAARERPERLLPLHPRPQPRRHSVAERHRFEHLRRLRDRQAAELGLDPALVASRATLGNLAHNWDQHAPALLPWQRDLLASR
jgi:ribonuclease D